MFFKRNYHLGTRWLVAVLFVSSVLLSLWLGSIAQATEPPKIEPNSVPALVQQGLEQYRRGKLQAAIAIWQAALNEKNLASRDRVTIQKYLARGYAQIGQSAQAIAVFNQLQRDYQQQGNRVEAGRMQTEQAQLYSRLGQQRKAIALLCQEERLVNVEQTDDIRCQTGSALAIARQSSDATGEVAALASLGNAYRLQGDLQIARVLLEQSLKLAERIHHSAYQIAILNNLGNTDASLAKRSDRRLKSAQQANETAAAEAFQQQANAYIRQARSTFQASLSLARLQGDRLNEMRSLLNLIASYQGNATDTPTQPSRSDLVQQAQSLLAWLPDTQEKAYFAMRFATLSAAEFGVPSAEMTPDRCPASQGLSKSQTYLKQAQLIAQNLHDRQTESLALGRLGHLHECRQDYAQALDLTQQALLLTQTAETRYQWEWQIGRILLAQGKRNPAIVAYETSVENLNALRGEFASAGRDFQFDFRDAVEPVYRKLAELQLEKALEKNAARESSLEARRQKSAVLSDKPQSITSESAAAAASNFLSSALETLDNLRLAELQNYLGSDCTVELVSQPITRVDEKVAVLSSIILGDRVAIILTLPDRNGTPKMQARWLAVSAQEVTQEVNSFRLKLERRADLTNSYLGSAQTLFNWLIRPFVADLQAAQIETLVFIHDGILRSIPMATLHDGTQFLVERYAIANALSLSLIDPVPIRDRALRVLAFGLTQPSIAAGIFFDPLFQVQQEIQNILAQVPGSRGWLNADFTRDRLQRELTEATYSVLHLATHGRFGIDSRETFLVTGEQAEASRTGTGNQTWKSTKQGFPSATKRMASVESSTLSETPSARAEMPPQRELLSMNQLYQMIRELPPETALELLTLTACETAVGSDRDALGIAGVSLQAGARSAIASLWQVDDGATSELITHFYRNLQQGNSRAQALQLAQKEWLQSHQNESAHPSYWAALILIGNWL